MNYEQLGKIRLYNADCMEVMKGFKDKQFDLAIVDPPYGIGVGKMNMGAGNAKKCSNINNRKWKQKDWDMAIPPDEFFDELFRVSENQIIWGGNYFNLPPCKNYVIWDKEIPNGLSFADCEMAWTSYANSPKIYKRSVYLNNSEKFHPTQKPVELYKWLLQKYAKDGDTILDTHFGSLSIGIACHDLGFELTAIELDKEYYEKAKERLIWHQKQTTLF